MLEEGGNERRPIILARSMMSRSRGSGAGVVGRACLGLRRWVWCQLLPGTQGTALDDAGVLWIKFVGQSCSRQNVHKRKAVRTNGAPSEWANQIEFICALSFRPWEGSPFRFSAKLSTIAKTELQHTTSDKKRLAIDDPETAPHSRGLCGLFRPFSSCEIEPAAPTQLPSWPSRIQVHVADPTSSAATAHETERNTRPATARPSIRLP